MLQRLALGLCLLILWCSASEARIIMTITNDGGGHIGDYMERYDNLRASGGTVKIDGVCASACTIVLGAMPRDQICVTPRARFGFHQAWSRGQAQDGASVAVADAEATALLFSLYPAPVRYWISRHGGLPPPAGELLWLQGRALALMYPSCL